jgi:hypothetical protein
MDRRPMMKTLPRRVAVEKQFIQFSSSRAVLSSNQATYRTMKLQTLLTHLITLVLLSVSLQAAGKRDALWNEVEDAASKGLPKTAVEKLGAIKAGALTDKAWPEAIKAVARRIVFEAQIQGAKPEEKIARMEVEIAKAPAEMQPVMQAILANWYWEYFQQNRWRFMRRTAVGSIPGIDEPGAPAAEGAEAKPAKDFTTWDLPRLFAEIDRQFTKALSAEAELKKIAVASFDELLVKGTVPDSYRPTLFDFLAHEALAFYASGEQAAAKAEDQFEIAADGPMFGTTEEFLKWNVADPASQVAGNHAKAETRRMRGTSRR